ncbi:flagellar protein FliO/FliZ [Kineococcus xinjiangensis]|uniref:Flagellar protein n=1 Tax=Kineococcus xinjiangensis TaxID=512762 RepID=A0A2S6IK19_9ACTN|nr:flagellar biosynthetic protein FliO [Kineococcus xinjiangensis]PPK94526.1 flagellar protein FliO/FliZ [Kineococcus xinjiangensis]
MIDSLAALGRMSVSLIAVLGLVWLITRWLRRSRAVAGGEVSVISRTAIGHKAGVAVVKVGGRALVVGVTEHQVSLLSEVDLDEVLPAGRDERGEGAPRTIRIPTQSAAAFDEALSLEKASTSDEPELLHSATEHPRQRETALAGSALSPATWTTALRVLRERTIRR